MKQKQFYFIYVFLLSMSFLGACSKDSPNELIPNTIVKIEIDKLPGKRIYFIGEELDVSDMTLKVFYSNETSEIVPVKKERSHWIQQYGTRKRSDFRGTQRQFYRYF